MRNIFCLSLIGFGLLVQSLALGGQDPKDLLPPFTLPTAEQSKAKISQNIISLSKWIERENQQSNEFLCLGERHDDLHRAMAKTILYQLKMDTLILEANAIEIEKFKNDLEKKQSFKHLGAELNEVLEASFAINPSLILLGAENTGNKNTDRDVAIALFVHSVLNRTHKPSKTVALYGSLHCGRQDWGLGQSVPFFQHLERNLKLHRFNNARLIIPSYNVEPQLLSLLLKLEIKDPVVVLRDAKSIDPIYFRYNAELMNLFQNYDDLIIDTRNVRQEN